MEAPIRVQREGGGGAGLIAFRLRPVASMSIVIESRFQGPPDSGNGGYVCGRLAAFLDVAVVSVRLRVPPPLDTPLEVRRSDAGVDLLDGDVVVARAQPGGPTPAPPSPPRFEEAEAAARHFRGFESHWFPSCFVCGPDREAGDGLRIFAGPIAEGLVGCPWVPDASLADARGSVRPEFLWAALDCPGGFAFPAPDRGAILLGELQVELLGDVAIGECCVLVAWETQHDGRKHHTGTALFGESGSCRGVGSATWFEVVARGADSLR